MASLKTRVHMSMAKLDGGRRAPTRTRTQSKGRGDLSLTMIMSICETKCFLFGREIIG